MKKYLLGLFAIALAIGFSAFTSVNVKKVTPSKFTTYYYEFTATSFTESDFENSNNWIALGTSAGSDPCPGDDINVCVGHASVANQNVSTLISYLQGLTPTASGATTYLTNSSNIDHFQP